MNETANSKTVFGFWVYLMTDCVLFASLFATYAVLQNNTYGSPGSHELFSLPFVLAETIILLTSSFTCGLALLAAKQRLKSAVLGWLIVTVILGLAFIGLEFTEFQKLVAEGNSWRQSAFLSAFFTLVGTHGLHIITGLVWASILVARIARQGVTKHTLRKLTMFGLFWHFLDIVWIFIFSIVYLMGVI